MEDMEEVMVEEVDIIDILGKELLLYSFASNTNNSLKRIVIIINIFNSKIIFIKAIFNDINKT